MIATSKTYRVVVQLSELILRHNKLKLAAHKFGSNIYLEPVNIYFICKLMPGPFHTCCGATIGASLGESTYSCRITPAPEALRGILRVSG